MNKLTFDDGLLNTYEVAFPIMRKHNVEGTVFVVTGILKGWIKTVGSVDRPFMDIRQILELADVGWEIGSHSVTHPRFDQISGDRAEWEIKVSKQHLEEFGLYPCCFAFPWGQHYTDYAVDVACREYGGMRWVRVTKEHPYAVEGVAIDTFPPPPISVDQVYVIHEVKDAEAFEKWIEDYVNRSA